MWRLSTSGFRRSFFSVVSSSQKRLVLLFCVSILLPLLATDGFSDESPSLPDPPTLLDNLPFKIEARGEATHFDRSQKFRIANTGDWGARTLGRSGGEQPLVHETDRWGGGYLIKAGTQPTQRLGFEASFRQSFLSREETKTVPGVGAGLLTSMAFIDGKPHGSASDFGFFISAATPAGVNAPGTTTLKYNQMYNAISIDAVHQLLRRPNIALDMFGGPAYHLFSQKYNFFTTGTNPVLTNLTTSQTRERLTDHLLGGRLGARAKAIFKRFSISILQGVDFFFRYSRFRGTQDIVNGSVISGAGFSSLTERIVAHDRQVGFTPRFDTNVNLSCKITERITVSFFYQFEQWLNLSRIENLIAAANASRLLNGPKTRIKDESLQSHAIGGAITIEF